MRSMQKEFRGLDQEIGIQMEIQNCDSSSEGKSMIL
jgi:hypothetical protein